MGCDIHAMIEVRIDGRWYNAGDPIISRNYRIFSILANVRNYDEVPFIATPRDLPEDATFAMKSLYKVDIGGHSASWVSLKEIINFYMQGKEEDILQWKQLIKKMKRAKKTYGVKTKHVRLVFYFDN